MTAEYDHFTPEKVAWREQFRARWGEPTMLPSEPNYVVIGHPCQEAAEEAAARNREEGRDSRAELRDGTWVNVVRIEVPNVCPETS